MYAFNTFNKIKSYSKAVVHKPAYRGTSVVGRGGLSLHAIHCGSTTHLVIKCSVVVIRYILRARIIFTGVSRKQTNLHYYYIVTFISFKHMKHICLSSKYHNYLLSMDCSLNGLCTENLSITTDPNTV